MKLRYLGVLALLLAPSFAFAASREIQELQRDVGLLQDQVKALQSSQDQKLAALTAMVQQAINNAGQANTSVAQIQGAIQNSLRDVENKVVTPVATLSTRMDQMSGDFRTLQQSVSDLNDMIVKLQAQLTDLSNAVKVIQAPPAPPPPGNAAAPGSTPNAAEAPAVPASTLYANASRDRSSGKLDLAVQEFSDYLKWYGNTDLAPNAQFYIAFIHYSQGDYDNAVKEFDTVLEKYPPDTTTKWPDALYYKGMSLTKEGQRTQGAEEFREFLKRFPNHDLARQACSQLTNMGLRCTAGRTSRGSRRK